MARPPQADGTCAEDSVQNPAMHDHASRTRAPDCPGPADPARVARRIAWWLGVLPSLGSALLGTALVLLPGLYALPQRDRPYGWLTDRLAVGGGWLLLGLAALFAVLAVALYARARRLAASG